MSVQIFEPICILISDAMEFLNGRPFRPNRTRLGRPFNRTRPGTPFNRTRPGFAGVPRMNRTLGLANGTSLCHEKRGTTYTLKLGFQGITLVIGIVSNIIALIVIRRSYKTSSGRRRRLSIPSFLVLVLVTLDLISAMALFLERVIITAIDHESLKSLDTFRDAGSVLRVSVSFARGLVITLMSLERCIALCAPFFYHLHATVYKALTGVIIICCFSLLISLLPSMNVGSYDALRMKDHGSTNNTCVRSMMQMDRNKKLEDICKECEETDHSCDEDKLTWTCLDDIVLLAIVISISSLMLITMNVCTGISLYQLRLMDQKDASRLNSLVPRGTTSYATSADDELNDNDYEKSIDHGNARSRHHSTATAVSENTSMRRGSSRWDVSDQNLEKNRARYRIEVRLATSICIIAVAFTATWLPYIVSGHIKLQHVCLIVS